MANRIDCDLIHVGEHGRIGWIRLRAATQRTSEMTTTIRRDEFGRQASIKQSTQNGLFLPCGRFNDDDLDILRSKKLDQFAKPLGVASHSSSKTDRTKVVVDMLFSNVDTYKNLLFALPDVPGTRWPTKSASSW